MEIKKATRQGVRPLICLYAESGCGKTMSALLLARGFVGPKGRIVMVDSESGRGSLYADVIAGGYDVIDLAEPFSPAHYVEAISAVEQSGASIGVLDSGSHEWEGISGVLDLAAESESKSGRTGLHNWKTPKFEHAKFVLKLLKSSIPWIICLRAKYKTRQGKDERGKTCIIKDDHVSPIQSEEYIFEMTAHAEVLPDHSIRLTKCSHPALRDCFPAKGPITSEHGAKIAAWCAAPSLSQGASPTLGSGAAVDRAAASPSNLQAPGSGAATPTTGAPPSDETSKKALKGRLWKITQPIHGGNADKLQEWMWDQAVTEPTEQLTTLPIERLESVLIAVEAKMKLTKA